MSDHSGLRYLFDQPNMNSSSARWLATISDFDFEIRYIINKEDKVVDAISRRVKMNIFVAVSSYGTNLHDWILQAG